MGIRDATHVLRTHREAPPSLPPPTDNPAPKHQLEKTCHLGWSLVSLKSHCDGQLRVGSGEGGQRSLSLQFREGLKGKLPTSQPLKNKHYPQLTGEETGESQGYVSSEKRGTWGPWRLALSLLPLAALPLISPCWPHCTQCAKATPAPGPLHLLVLHHWIVSTSYLVLIRMLPSWRGQASPNYSIKVQCPSSSLFSWPCFISSSVQI